jgi:competence protein ComEC
MKVLKYPVIPLTFFVAAGIFAAQLIKPGINSALLLSGVSILLLVPAYITSKKQLLQKPWFTLTALLFAFSIGFSAWSLTYPPYSQNHYCHIINGQETPVIKGYISERLKPNNYNEKYYFKVTSVDKKAASGKLLVTVPKDSLNNTYNAGDILYIAAIPQPVSGSMNPFQFSYADYMEKQGVFHQVKLKNNFIQSGQIQNFDYCVGRLRNRLSGSIEQQHYSASVTNVLKALLLGQRQDIDSELNQSYTDAGVIHILAISGLHIGVLFYILNLLLKPLQRLKGKGRLLRLLALLLAMWSFAIIAGLSASVVRAVVMFSFVSIGQYINRSTNTFNSIAVSMLVLLLAKPSFLFDAGFQLSYAAVFAIVWMHPLYSRIKPSKYKAINYFTQLVAVSTVAQLGVLPLSLYYFNQFPLLFPIANIVVIPLSTAVLILGIIMLIISFLHTDVAAIAGVPLKFMTQAMNSFIQWIASFKTLTIKDIPFNLLLMVTLYVLILCSMLWMFKKSYKRTMALLAVLAVFQLTYMIVKQQAGNVNEIVIFHNWEHSLIAEKKDNKVTFYSTDSLAAANLNVKSYLKGNFIDSIHIKPINNLYWHSGRRILVLDSMGVYSAGMRPDVLLLTQSPKINLERTLDSLKPSVVIADATNYKTYVSRWQATCKKRKIPFHATAEKGSYTIR